jgi:hypothetical protein
LQSYGKIQLRLANIRIQERINEASRARLAGRAERSSLRRSVGHSMIRIGRRLAAEPLRPARQR